MTKSLRKAIMVRTKLKNIYYRLPTDEKLRIFKKQRNYCVKLLHKTKRNFYGNIGVAVQHSILLKTTNPHCFMMPPNVVWYTNKVKNVLLTYIKYEKTL